MVDRAKSMTRQHFVSERSRLENIVTYPPLATICHLAVGGDVGRG